MEEITRQRYERPRVRSSGRLISTNPAQARILDIIGASAAIILFAPLMLVVAVAIFITSPGPVVFSQKRIGRNGRLFKCYKFRTMVVDAEARLDALLKNDPVAAAEWAADRKLRNDPRIIGIGDFLRKSSFDELPQLFNVLAGQMSLVGPRPIVPSEAAKYGRYFEHYCMVRPGLTGLWQISGRNDVDYRRRIAFDVVYVRKGNVGDNIKILLLTVPSVLKRDGSY